MKKMLGFIVAVAVLAASSMSVFAASTTDLGTGAYTTSGTEVGSENAMMTILVLNGTIGQGVTVDSIQYIDQTVADAAGAFAFSNYIPKVAVPAGGTYNVYVGGQNLAGPISGGTINGAPVVSNFKFSGTIEKLGELTSAVVTLTNISNTSLVYSVNADKVTGAFEISVPPAEYSVTVSKIAHMTRSTAKVDLKTADVAKNYKLRAGDVDNTQSVNINDITSIIDSYGTVVGNANYVVERDIDETNSININDITSTIDNYGTSAANFDNE